MYDNLVNKCEDCVSECDSLDTEKIKPKVSHRRTKNLDVPDYKILKKNTKIESFESGETFSIRLIGEDSGQKYAEARYVIFQEYSIGVIDWIQVNLNIRGNGIGRLIRSEVLSDMNDMDIIYSKIVNDKLISVAIDQGFKKIRHGDLKGWFILD